MAVNEQTQCGDLLDFNAPLKPLIWFEGGILNQDQGHPVRFRGIPETAGLDRPHHSKR